MMVEGFLLRREMQRSDTDQMMHLQRLTVKVLIDLSKMFEKHPKPTDALDIWPIPSIDEGIKKARTIEKQKFEERAERVLQKYKNLGKNEG